MIMLPALLLLVGGAIYWFTHRQPRLRGELVALPDHRDGTTAPVGTPSPPASGGVRIEVGGLAKRFGHVPAVDSVSFSVEPGRVTAFLGPNGAGKTTTLRMLLGLAAPTAGTATIGGLRYDELDRPVRSVGAVLEGGAAHRGRTGRNHLRIICRAGGVPLERADEVLGSVDSVIDSLERPSRTLVRTPDADKLVAELGEHAVVTPGPDGDVYVSGVDAMAIGEAANRAGIALYQLTTERPGLEDVFLQLTTGEAAIR